MILRDIRGFKNCQVFGSFISVPVSIQSISCLKWLESFMVSARSLETFRWHFIDYLPYAEKRTITMNTGMGLTGYHQVYSHSLVSFNHISLSFSFLSQRFSCCNSLHSSEGIANLQDAQILYIINMFLNLHKACYVQRYFLNRKYFLTKKFICI